MTDELFVRGTQARRRTRRLSSSSSALLCVAVACAASACVSRVCRERLLDLVESPDHRYNAALLVRNCEDAPKVVTHVNLHAGYGGPPADGDGSATRGEVFSVEGEQKVKIVWKGARSLQVECAGCGAARVLKREGSWDDVQITYDGRE